MGVERKGPRWRWGGQGAPSSPVRKRRVVASQAQTSRKARMDMRCEEEQPRLCSAETHRRPFLGGCGTREGKGWTRRRQRQREQLKGLLTQPCRERPHGGRPNVRSRRHGARHRTLMQRLGWRRRERWGCVERSWRRLGWRERRGERASRSVECDGLQVGLGRLAVGERLENVVEGRGEREVQVEGVAPRARVVLNGAET